MREAISQILCPESFRNLMAKGNAYDYLGNTLVTGEHVLILALLFHPAQTKHYILEPLNYLPIKPLPCMV